PEPHSTRELGMRRRHAAVEDIYGHATTASAAPIRGVEWKLALVDPVESHGGGLRRERRGAAAREGGEAEGPARFGFLGAVGFEADSSDLGTARQHDGRADRPAE